MTSLRQHLRGRETAQIALQTGETYRAADLLIDIQTLGVAYSRRLPVRGRHREVKWLTTEDLDRQTVVERIGPFGRTVIYLRGDDTRVAYLWTEEDRLTSGT